MLHSATGPAPSGDRATHGDVAQLEEHRVRIAGVRGSSPLISTISPIRDVELVPRRLVRLMRQFRRATPLASNAQ